MRISELFEDITVKDIQKIEALLDKRVYQPADAMKSRDRAVFDLELPTNSAHFIERVSCRDKPPQSVTPEQIARLLARARVDPKLGVKDQLDKLAFGDPNDVTLQFIDPETNLQIPVVVKPNRRCAKVSNHNKSVCVTHKGELAPRNKIFAKTIFRKGAPEAPGCSKR